MLSERGMKVAWDIVTAETSLDADRAELASRAGSLGAIAHVALLEIERLREGAQSLVDQWTEHHGEGQCAGWPEQCSTQLASLLNPTPAQAVPAASEPTEVAASPFSAQQDDGQASAGVDLEAATLRRWIVEVNRLRDGIRSRAQYLRFELNRPGGTSETDKSFLFHADMLERLVLDPARLTDGAS